MSTTIIPDIYRHIARKSTVSRNVKPPSKNVSLCNSTFNINNNSKEEQSIFDTIQCDIKLEKDIPQQEQSFVILPDNEIEQMNIEQTNDEIICDIIEQIKNQIPEYFTNHVQRRTISTDIHYVIDSLMNHIDQTDNEQSINTTNNESMSTTNDVQMEDENRSLNEEVSMDSSQQSSILSRSHIDDDIVEVEVSTSNIQSPSCTCQCHQSTTSSLLTNPSSEYILFEQALRQTREEQEQERSLNNNHLIQTLKRQHQELLNLYNRQLNINKIDREQQTNHINQHDSQIQTDLITTTTTATQQQNYKPNIHQQVNGTHSTPNAKGPTVPAPRPFNSFLTPIRTTGPSLQQLIPCLTTTTSTTTTLLTNKTTMIKKPIPVAKTSPHPPPSTSAPVSHDVVDLTEDDDDNANRAVTQKNSPIKLQQSPASVSSSPPTTAVTNRIQPVNRPVRPNTNVPHGQTFPLRPLPEHNPCDHTIARPQLSITHDNTTVRLTWNLPSTPMESIQNYEIYAYKQSAAATTSDWRKIGIVNSMRLPMAVTLKEFQSNSHYAFAVRALAINNNIGPFCEPKTIFTGNTLSTNQILDA